MTKTTSEIAILRGCEPGALAIEGGEPEIVSKPIMPVRWGDAERDRLNVMLDQRSLFYWKGPQTEALIKKFTEHYPLEYVMPCSSGTAALHIAVAAAGIEPGDEVIVPPITDMGTVIGVLYQQGVPVFADVDPHTYNLDLEDVKKKITPKTRAIIAVHLAGNPMNGDELRKLADASGLVIIEDCAQAWGSKWKGQPVGTFGHIGAYSLNDFKHIGCGDGGIVASSDLRFGPQLQKYGDKAYDRAAGIRAPEFLAPNYRISEPQSAVAVAQLNRMTEITGIRAALGIQLGRELSAIPGIDPHRVEEGACSTFWFYLMRIKEGWKPHRDEIARALAAEGVEASSGYIPTPIYRYPVFQNHRFFGNRWPLRDLGLTSMDYRSVCCPVAEEILKSCIYLRIHQGMDEAYIEGVARAVRKLSQRYYL